MATDKFTRREVERSFRKFKDIVSDLRQSQFQTWGDTFTHLITHCEQDPIMRIVTDPLRANRNVDAPKWYADCLASVTGMIGSGHYQLPTDDDDRTALLYQFFLELEANRVDLNKFCVAVYGRTKYQEMVHVFNNELVRKFTREVSYRLDEILHDIGGADEVPREAMMVFHYHDHSQHDHSLNIQGNIQGSNVAAGSSTITDSAATYNSRGEVIEALTALKPLVAEVAENQRDAVEAALQVLVEATQKDIPVARVAPAVAVVADASPGLKQRLKDIAGKIGLSLVSSSLFQAFKWYFGIH